MQECWTLHYIIIFIASQYDCY